MLTGTKTIEEQINTLTSTAVNKFSKKVVGVYCEIITKMIFKEEERNGTKNKVSLSKAKQLLIIYNMEIEEATPQLKKQLLDIPKYLSITSHSKDIQEKVYEQWNHLQVKLDNTLRSIGFVHQSFIEDAKQLIPDQALPWLYGITTEGATTCMYDYRNYVDRAIRINSVLEKLLPYIKDPNESLEKQMEDFFDARKLNNIITILTPKDAPENPIEKHHPNFQFLNEDKPIPNEKIEILFTAKGITIENAESIQFVYESKLSPEKKQDTLSDKAILKKLKEHPSTSQIQETKSDPSLLETRKLYQAWEKLKSHLGDPKYNDDLVKGADYEKRIALAYGMASITQNKKYKDSYRKIVKEFNIFLEECRKRYDIELAPTLETQQPSSIPSLSTLVATTSTHTIKLR